MISCSQCNTNPVFLFKFEESTQKFSFLCGNCIAEMVAIRTDLSLYKPFKNLKESIIEKAGEYSKCVKSIIDANKEVNDDGKAGVSKREFSKLVRKFDDMVITLSDYGRELKSSFKLEDIETEKRRKENFQALIGHMESNLTSLRSSLEQDQPINQIYAAFMNFSFPSQINNLNSVKREDGTSQISGREYDLFSGKIKEINDDLEAVNRKMSALRLGISRRSSESDGVTGGFNINPHSQSALANLHPQAVNVNPNRNNLSREGKQPFSTYNEWLNPSFVVTPNPNPDPLPQPQPNVVNFQLSRFPFYFHFSQNLNSFIMKYLSTQTGIISTYPMQNVLNLDRIKPDFRYVNIGNGIFLSGGGSKGENSQESLIIKIDESKIEFELIAESYPPMIFARKRHNLLYAETFIGGQPKKIIFALSGLKSVKCEFIYIEAQPRWNELPQLNCVRSNASTMYYNNSVIIYGGYDSENERAYLNSIEILSLDALTNRNQIWNLVHFTQSAIINKSAFSSLILPSGKVHIFGGFNGSNCRRHHEAEILNDNEWTIVESVYSLPLATLFLNQDFKLGLNSNYYACDNQGRFFCANPEITEVRMID